MTALPDDMRRSRTAFLWVGVVMPLLIVLFSTAVLIAWLPQLPDPVATHWGTNGVDGFGPAWTYPALTAGVGGGLIVVFALTGVFAHRMPASSTKPPIAPWSPTTRFLAAINLGFAVFMSGVSLLSAGVQLGLDDAADAPDIGPWVLLGFVVLAGVTALGWFLQPKSPVSALVTGERAEAFALGDAERAAWFGTATMARGGVLLLLIGTAVLALAAVFVGATGDPSAWILAAVTALMVLLIATMVVFRVRVNAAGLQVRSLLGWPRTRIPLDRIAEVQTAQVNPLAEFGGWGWRFAVDGRRGVVLRAGEALQVTRTDGRVFVVTVDGAADAAAVLQTLRAHSA